MSSASEVLRANVRRILRDSGLSQSELARRAGLTPAYISQLLSGVNQSPGLDQLEQIAKALGITPSRLLAGPDDKPSAIDCLDEAIRLMKEVRERGVDSPDVRALFGHPPKK